MNALILCNGQPPPGELFQKRYPWADLFIAADGGGNTARTFGTVPDVVIGDLDSFEPQEDDAFEVIHKPDQYANDLEKALQLSQKRGALEVIILGATGLRLDHTLKNLSVLKQFDEQFNSLVMEDAFGTMQLLPARYRKKIPVGTSVSLFPLSGRVGGITIKGLKYVLKDDFMENGVRDGSSNTVVHNPVSITHKKGDLLLFIAK